MIVYHVTVISFPRPRRLSSSCRLHSVRKGAPRFLLSYFDFFSSFFHPPRKWWPTLYRISKDAAVAVAPSSPAKVARLNDLQAVHVFLNVWGALCTSTPWRHGRCTRRVRVPFFFLSFASSVWIHLLNTGCPLNRFHPVLTLKLCICPNPDLRNVHVQPTYTIWDLISKQKLKLPYSSRRKNLINQNLKQCIILTKKLWTCSKSHSVYERNKSTSTTVCNIISIRNN